MRRFDLENEKDAIELRRLMNETLTPTQYRVEWLDAESTAPQSNLVYLREKNPFDLIATESGYTLRLHTDKQQCHYMFPSFNYKFEYDAKTSSLKAVSKRSDQSSFKFQPIEDKQ